MVVGGGGEGGQADRDRDYRWHRTVTLPKKRNCSGGSMHGPCPNTESTDPERTVRLMLGISIRSQLVNHDRSCCGVDLAGHSGLGKLSC